MNPLSSIRQRLAALSPSDLYSGIVISRSGLIAAALYFLYGILVFCVAFAGHYYMSRADEIVRDQLASVGAVDIAFAHLEPHLFPPHATFERVRVMDRRTKIPFLFLDRADVCIGVLPLLTGKLKFEISAAAYGGEMLAHVASGALLDTSTITGDLRLDGIVLHDVPQVVDYDASLRGMASLRTSFAGKWASPEAVDVAAAATIRIADMENRFPIVKGGRLQDVSLVVDCTMRNGRLSISRLDLGGMGGVSFMASGVAVIHPGNIQQSELDLKGRFQGPADRIATNIIDKRAADLLHRKQAVPVVIKGRLKAPQIEMR